MSKDPKPCELIPQDVEPLEQTPHEKVRRAREGEPISHRPEEMELRRPGKGT